MRVGFLADIHVANHRKNGGPQVGGMNIRARAILRTLNGAVLEANAAGCRVLVVCGDLFDSCKPEPQLVAAVMQLFDLFGGEVHVIVGNHEQVSDDGGDHALGPLQHANNNVHVHEKPTTVSKSNWPFELALVPFQNGKTAEWLPGVLSTFGYPALRQHERQKQRLLVLHAGISDEHTAFFLRDADDSIPADVLFDLMKKHRVGATFAGNWHTHRSWQAQDQFRQWIVQCGALVPTGWDNPGMDDYGSLIVYDTEDSCWERKVLPGPRFIKVRTQAEYIAAATQLSPGLLYVQWEVEHSELGPASAQLRDDVLMHGLAAGEVRPITASKEAAVRAAATSARASASNTEGAIRAYVAEMPLPATVSREAVLNRVLAHMVK